MDAQVERPTIVSSHAATFLSTEHWHLLGTRSMGWNESFSRTSIFLNAVSAAAVALALVFNAAGTGRTFTAFALAIFPIVLFLGVTTYVRLVRINLNDAFIIAATNRLRRAYIEMAPEIEPYLTSGTHDDMRGVYQSILLGQMQPKSPWPHVMVTTPMVVLILNSLIAAAGAAFATHHAGAGDVLTGIVAVAVAIAVGVAQAGVQARAVRVMQSRPARFPSPEASE
jgi:hypothetical protein